MTAARLLAPRIVAVAALAVASVGAAPLAVAAPAASVATQPESSTAAYTEVDPAAYPYPTARTNQQDPWGFSIRQCTSYAAWWLNAHGLNLTSYTRGPGGVARFGNASGWAASAAQAGWAISATPQVGAIAQWDAGESSSWDTGGSIATFTAGSLGHVAVVTAIDETTGLATLNAYNVDDRYSYSVMQGVAPRYLLIGFATSASSGGTVATPVTRSISGVVMVYDRFGRRTGIRKVPVTAVSGDSKGKVTSLTGGGFRTKLPAPGPWKMTAKVRGHHCATVTVPITSEKSAAVHIVCKA